MLTIDTNLRHWLQEVLLCDSLEDYVGRVANRSKYIYAFLQRYNYTVNDPDANPHVREQHPDAGTATNKFDYIWGPFCAFMEAQKISFCNLWKSRGKAENERWLKRSGLKFVATLDNRIWLWQLVDKSGNWLVEAPTKTACIQIAMLRSIGRPVEGLAYVPNEELLELLA